MLAASVVGLSINVAEANTFETQLVELQRTIQARGAAQVNLQQQIFELQEEVSDLRGVTEMHTHKLEQIVDRQRELYVEIERRLSNINVVANSSETLVENTIVEETDTETSDTNYTETTLDENDAYDLAVNLILKERRYDDAIPEFETFIKTFPESIYIANAHYWLGQLQFNKANFKEASNHFDKVIRFYPDSNKRSDSILKQAKVMLKLEDKVKAKSLFEQVIREYPDSNSASLAKSKLASF